jgi:hypothetical protein
MDSTLKAAVITGAATVFAAAIGAWKLHISSAPKEFRNVTAKTDDIRDSQVAQGNHLKQHHGDVQNYFANPAAAGPFAGKIATKPTMAEIANAIIAADPYDRTQIPKKYVGLAVSWPVVFSGIEEAPYGGWYATFDSPDEGYRSVVVSIDLEQYPQLRVVTWGHLAWVEGKIHTAGVRIVTLEDGAVITLE